MAQHVFVSGGGLDSAALVYASALGMIDRGTENAIVLHVDYGQTAAERERKACYDITYYTQRVILDGRSTRRYEVHTLTVGAHTPKRYNADSPLFGGEGNPFIRGRNLWLLMQAAGEAIRMYGTSTQIVLEMGLCAEQMMFDDANPEFIARADALFENAFGYDTGVGLPLVRVQAPMLERGWQKLPLFTDLWDRISRLAGGHTAQEMLFHLPFTCWTPNEQGGACGTCYHCEKLRTLQVNVRDDITKRSARA